EPHLPGVEVTVSRSKRWKRLKLTFRHPRFTALLPEQRFRSLLQMIPKQFYEKHLRGAVWFELAPGESEEDVSKARRSQDVAGAEPKIARKLHKVTFFEALATAMGDGPIEACTGDFSFARRALTDKGMTGDEQRDACLVFMRHGAYCDCEVLLAAGPALAKLYPQKKTRSAKSGPGDSPSE
ncbi:MAG: DUF2695 domain-containing protein, partial [Planctomycetota bacterium]